MHNMSTSNSPRQNMYMLTPSVKVRNHESHVSCGIRAFYHYFYYYYCPLTFPFLQSVLLYKLFCFLFSYFSLFSLLSLSFFLHSLFILLFFVSLPPPEFVLWITHHCSPHNPNQAFFHPLIDPWHTPLLLRALIK